MADKKETIADIIAWLRRPREGENAYLTLWRDEIADRLEAAWKRERELTKPAENVNSGAASDTAGNCAKLREALKRARNVLLGVRDTTDNADILDGVIYCLEEYINPALAAPPRNCDVGTPKEQHERHNCFCYAHRVREKGCSDCPLNGEPCCELAWAQMPYESEAGK